jgi:uncharacterized membrane protein YbhN (UPF0104 family)
LARVLELIENDLAQMESANWAAAAVTVALHIANVVVRAHAWRNIVAAAYPAQHVRKGKIFLAYAAGAGVNAVSPWRGGELLRLSLARRSVSTSTYSGLASTVAAESIFNLFATGGLLAWAVARGAVPAPDLGVLFELIATVAALLLAALCLGCGKRLRRPLVTGFGVFRDPVAYLRRVAAWQALDWLLRLATISAFMVAFGIDGGVETVLLVQGAQSASSLLPLAPARIGTKQAVLVYVLGSQVPTASLLAFVAGSELLLAGTNAPRLRRRVRAPPRRHQRGSRRGSAGGLGRDGPLADRAHAETRPGRALMRPVAGWFSLRGRAGSRYEAGAGGTISRATTRLSMRSARAGSTRVTTQLRPLRSSVSPGLISRSSRRRMDWERITPRASSMTSYARSPLMARILPCTQPERKPPALTRPRPSRPGGWGPV